MLKLFFSFPSDCAPCCDTCPTEGDYDVTVSGYTQCGCAIDNVLPGVFFFKDLSHTDVTGAFTTPVATGTSTIGTVELQNYSDICVTPDGAPYDVDAIIRIICTGPGNLSVDVTITNSQGDLYQVFIGTGVFGSPISNTVTCDGGTFFNVPFILGTITVDLP